MIEDFDIDGLFEDRDDGPFIITANFGSGVVRSLLERAAVPPPPPVTFNWTEDQLRAVEDIVRWRHDPTAPRYFKLTGAAGTGKTTVLQEVRRRLKGTKIAFSAMTGKAAMRLRLLSGAKTKTFHSAIYHPPLEVDNVEEGKIDLDFAHVRNDGDETALLIVDEGSMMGVKMKNDADQSAYTKVLVVGDPFQLPPVLSRAEEEECGADYSVFTGTPGPHLDRVMRNAGAVLAAATVIRMEKRIPTASEAHGGSRYDYAEYGSPDTVIARAVEEWLEDRVGHVLITWRNGPRLDATNIIRRRLGRTSPMPEVGEPVVIRKNDHKKGIMNGDSAEVVEIGAEGPTIAGIDTRWFALALASTGGIVEILAPFDFTGTMPYVPLDKWRKAIGEARLSDKRIDDVIPITFGYVLTCHLAQGDQYRRTTTFLPGDFRSQHFNKPTRLPDGNVMPFSMRFSYTALTRSMERAGMMVSK